GWQLADVVGGGDDVDRLRFVLEPVEHGAEDSAAGPAVGAAVRSAHTAECFLDLIDPENTGADGLRGLNDGSEVCFGLTDQPAEQLPGIELQQRDAEDAGRGFGGETLAGSGNTEDKHALGDGQAIVTGTLGERFPPLQQPLLESGQSADVIEGGGSINHFEK